VGSTVSALRCVTTPTSVRSLVERSSTSRTERGRPTLMGTTDIGNNTEFRSGKIAMRSGRCALSVERMLPQ
jgi:hypothetical protein